MAIFGLTTLTDISKSRSKGDLPVQKRLSGVRKGRPQLAPAHPAKSLHSAHQRRQTR
jgi:hypothetical protein